MYIFKLDHQEQVNLVCSVDCDSAWLAWICVALYWRSIVLLKSRYSPQEHQLELDSAKVCLEPDLLNGSALDGLGRQRAVEKACSHARGRPFLQELPSKKFTKA